MLSYIAHIPHSPMLLPNISRSAFRNFKKTTEAIESIAHDLYSMGCDIVVFISPYGAPAGRSHVLNVSPKFTIEFSKFGDFMTSEHALGEFELAYHIRRDMGMRHPVISVTKTLIDSASGAGAMHISSPEKKYRVLPVLPSAVPVKNLFEFGKELRDVIDLSPSRIAVISLGDMSRTRQGEKTQASQLDKEIIGYVNDKNTPSFINYNADKINSFYMCGFRPLAVVLGMLDGVRYDFDVLRYSQKYGVGLLAARFII